MLYFTRTGRVLLVVLPCLWSICVDGPVRLIVNRVLPTGRRGRSSFECRQRADEYGNAQMFGSKKGLICAKNVFPRGVDDRNITL